MSLNDNLEEGVYIDAPPRFEKGFGDKVYNLKNPIYGFKNLHVLGLKSVQDLLQESDTFKGSQTTQYAPPKFEKGFGDKVYNLKNPSMDLRISTCLIWKVHKVC